MPDHNGRESLETEAQPDGRVLCPRPECGKLVGAFTTEQSRYFCRHCKVEIIVRQPTLEMRLRTADFQANMSNPGKRHLIALFLASDLQASANRARALELIALLPEEHVVDTPAPDE